VRLTSAASRSNEFLLLHRLPHGRGAMKVLFIVVGLIVTATLAHAEDMAQMISQYAASTAFRRSKLTCS